MLAVFLCSAPGAAATVFTGSATDPANDLSPFGGDPVAQPAVDFTSVSVRYDDATGRVDVTYGFNRAPGSSQEVNPGVGLGTLLADGSCSAPFFSSLGWRLETTSDPRGEAFVEGHSTGVRGGSVTGVSFNYDTEGEGWQTTAPLGWSGSRWAFSTGHSSLVGRHYTCVHAGMWLNAGGPGTGPGEDFLDSRSFALSAVSAAPGSAEWLSPRDGQTVSGLLTEGGAGAQRCEARITGPVVRTENYVDGRLNDTQVFHPWGCVWDTRNFVNGGHLLTVKAYDAAGNVIAADTVRVVVNNPNPPPVDNPPPPSIETSPGGVVTPPPPTASGSQPSQALTARRARRAAKSALARRYGRAFRLRKGYTAKCRKASDSRWSCAVRWRYGKAIYKGKVTLRLRPDGRIATQVVLRKIS